MDDYVFQFDSVLAAYDQLLAGALLTVRLTAEAIVLGMAIAVLAAWGATAGPRPLRRAVGAYVEVVRNTPFLLQLYFFFFGLPSLGLRLTPNQAGLLTMVVNLSAYATEIVRAGIESVPHGQVEAARALGLRPWNTFRLVVLRQALRAVYPPLAGQFTVVLLGSSVVSAIAASELTSAANLLQSVTFRTFETYLVVTFIYLGLALLLRALLGGLYLALFSRGGMPAARL